MLTNKVVIYLCFLLILVSCTHSYKPHVLKELPSWTDKYYVPGTEFFKISSLVENLNLNRLQAVELQNRFRDLTLTGVSRQRAFEEALKLVKENNFESRIDPAKLSSAPFIVVLDLDEMFLQQYYTTWKEGPKYYDYIINLKNEKRGVKLAPGAIELIKAIKKLGGLNIIFSANEDATVWALANEIKVDGAPLKNFVDGVLSYNYLLLEGKEEWVQKKGGLNDSTVIPSKDLRPLDESLSKIIIIDDNPKRIIQHNRQRLTKKFFAGPYFTNEVSRMAWDRQLKTVKNEIEESVKYSKANKTPFAVSYLPYSALGQVTVKWLVENGSFSREGAIKHLREHPALVDEKF